MNPYDYQSGYPPNQWPPCPPGAMPPYIFPPGGFPAGPPPSMSGPPPSMQLSGTPTSVPPTMYSQNMPFPGAQPPYFPPGFFNTPAPQYTAPENTSDKSEMKKLASTFPKSNLIPISGTSQQKISPLERRRADISWDASTSEKNVKKSLFDALGSSGEMNPLMKDILQSIGMDATTSMHMAEKEKQEEEDRRKAQADSVDGRPYGIDESKMTSFLGDREGHSLQHIDLQGLFSASDTRDKQRPVDSPKTSGKEREGKRHDRRRSRDSSGSGSRRHRHSSRRRRNSSGSRNSSRRRHRRSSSSERSRSRVRRSPSPFSARGRNEKKKSRSPFTSRQDRSPFAERSGQKIMSGSSSRDTSKETGSSARTLSDLYPKSRVPQLILVNKELPYDRKCDPRVQRYLATLEQSDHLDRIRSAYDPNDQIAAQDTRQVFMPPGRVDSGAGIKVKIATNTPDADFRRVLMTDRSRDSRQVRGGGRKSRELSPWDGVRGEGATKQRRIVANPSPPSPPPEFDDTTIDEKDERQVMLFKKDSPKWESTESLTKKRDVTVERLSHLERELQRLSRLGKELSRKKPRSRDRDRDPNIQENVRLQKELQLFADDLRGDVKALDEALAVSKLALEDKFSEDNLSFSHSYRDTYYYWCEDCLMHVKTLNDLYRHLESNSHNEKRKFKKPAWKKEEETPVSKKIGYALDKGCVKGTEFLWPVKGFYCEICSDFFGTHKETDTHMKTFEHNQRYKSLLKVFPSYELILDHKKKYGRSLKEKEEEQTEEKTDRPKVVMQFRSTKSNLSQGVQDI